MRGNLTRFAVAGVIVGSALLPACGGSSGGETATVAGRRLATRTAKVGAVTLKVTPRRIDARMARFSLVLDTHEGSLDSDPAAGAQLVVGGIAWVAPTWRGDGPGSHHRQGELRFRPAGPVRGPISLSVAERSRAVRFVWNP